MKIGVRLHDFGKSTPKLLAEKACKMGFDGAQLVLNKAIEGQSGLAGSLNKDVIYSISKEFADKKLEIAMLGAYFNPVHSNKQLVMANIAKFKEHLKYANDFNCLYVGSETGSFNDDKWTYNPLNRTEEAFNEVKRIFSDILAYAKEVNSNIAIEGAYGHCCYEPKVLKRLLDEIDNGHMFITVDLYNYLAISNYTKQHEIFDECLDLFKGKIVIFHLKDFIVENDSLKQVGLGQGLMDFDYIMPKIIKQCPNAYLIFEGVKPEDMESSLKKIKSYL